MRGRLITFEGGEGTGKSTHAALLAERLKGLGIVGQPTLLVVSEVPDGLKRAARNVAWLSLETPGHVSVYQLIRSERVVFEKAALLALQETLKS